MAPESADLIFADPPFNVKKKYGQSKAEWRQDYYEWCDAWLAECFRLLGPSGSLYLMTIPRHLGAVFPMLERRGHFIGQVVWRHSGLSGKRRFWNAYQPILVYGKTGRYKFNTYAQRRETLTPRWGKYSTAPQGQMLDIWDDIPYVFAGGAKHREAILRPGTNAKLHPCQMPVALARRAILFSTDEGDTVFEPFAGIGAMGVACAETGRNYVGVECESVYVEIARRRILGDSPVFNREEDAA